MSDDLVNRLRGQEPSIINYWGRTELEQIAATEIERLEAEVFRLTNLAQEGENRGLEKAAKVVDEGAEVVHGDNSRTIRPRKHGDIMGTAYATAIRALIPQEQEEKGK